MIKHQPLSTLKQFPKSRHFLILCVGTLLSFFLGASVVTAQPKPWKKGILSGRVVDEETKESLAGASVIIKELAIGMAADANGTFTFTELRPGLYTVEVSVVGYAVVRLNQIIIRGDEETKLEIALKPSALPLGEEIIVIGKRPLLDVHSPAVTRGLSAEELQRLVTSDIKDVIALQPGAVKLENEIHLRGGRSYENQLLIDGLSASDPLVRSGIGLPLTAGSINRLDIHTGGIPALYGQATSGIVEVVTRDPLPHFVGRIVYRTDQLGFNAPFDLNTDQVTIDLSGPEPISQNLFRRLGLQLPGSVTILLSGAAQAADGYLGHPNNLYASSILGGRHFPRANNRLSGLAKVLWKIDANHRLSFVTQQHVTVNQDRSILETRVRTATYSFGYPFEYRNLLRNYNVFTHWINLQTLQWEQRVSPNYSYTLLLSRFFSNLHSDVNGKQPAEYQNPVDDEPYTITISPDSQYYTVTRGDGFFDSGDGDTWYDHTWASYTLKGDLTAQFKRAWQAQFGFETAYRRLRVLDIFEPYVNGGAGVSRDIYETGTGDGAFYCQNDWNLKGAILRLGLRYDIWWPGGYVEKVLGDTAVPSIPDTLRQAFRRDTFSLFGHRAKGLWAPRISMSNMISGNLSMVMSYSRLNKRPNPQYVYANLGSQRNQSTYQLFGNPNLAPEKVILIELGFKYLIGENDALSINGYSKSIPDYISAIGITTINGSNIFPAIIYLNFDAATSKGIETEYRKRIGNWFEAIASFTYSQAKGERSLPSDILKGVTSRINGVLYQELLFDWDKPWQLNLQASFQSAKNRRYRLWPVNLPDQWNASFTFWAQAGKRYTKFTKITDQFGEVQYRQVGSLNDHLGPWWSSFDCSIEKFFEQKGWRWSLRLDIQNLFNHRNVTIINPLTGNAYKPGDEIPTSDNFLLTPPTDYRLPIWEIPAQYLSPRQIKLGVSVCW